MDNDFIEEILTFASVFKFQAESNKTTSLRRLTPYCFKDDLVFTKALKKAAILVK